MDLSPEILGYYELGREQSRLIARDSLELIRTRILLQRFLPPAPARVLDVGGGSGIRATWLAAQAYEVQLLDPVPLHVEQARAAGVSARVGDARDLDAEADSYDAVLLLGPLYHLVDRADRVGALAEAVRVVRPGGVVMAAAISRYVGLFDGYYRGFVDRPGFGRTIQHDIRTGQHSNPDDVPGQFTTAYFHDPAQLPGELTDAGLTVEAVLPIEGPLRWAPGLRERLADDEQRTLILALLQQVETDPHLLAASSHLLAVGRPAGPNCLPSLPLMDGDRPARASPPTPVRAGRNHPTIHSFGCPQVRESRWTHPCRRGRFEHVRTSSILVPPDESTGVTSQ